MKNKLQFCNLIVAAILPLTGCRSFDSAALKIGEATNNETLIKASSDLTPKQEYYLGRSIFARVFASQSVLKSEEIQAYVNQLGQYLAIHSSRPLVFNGYRFVVLDDAAPTALSAPGGFVAVSFAFLKLIRNEDELAAVLAHEIAHVALKHAEENIKASNRMELGKQIVSVLAFANPNARQLKVFSDAISAGIDAKFNQNQESEADANALTILKRAGYSPRALLNVISRIPNTATFLSKHPRNEDRLEDIKKLAAEGNPNINPKAAQRYISTLRSINE